MRVRVLRYLFAALGFGLPATVWAMAGALSGIYPHLAMFNDEAECGTGAVVPWANRLWVVTYAPHQPGGSTDKLYEITPDLRQIIRPESIGGTPANRMIHRESQQLFIGPYAVDARGGVRVIPYINLFGRPTGTARHLTSPADKIYYATMEEGFYEVDVRTLAVTELFTDEYFRNATRGPRAARTPPRFADLPGYHGKGLYSGQGRLIYANNGEQGTVARQRPDVPSGCLAEWDGRADTWTVVRRNQFTEVTGPGGLSGNAHPDTDPIWSIGWDHRSLILMLRTGGTWRAFRLPKASHSYDGAHGWNTEWPRIRDIGEPDLLMTMHGMFWRFPRDFGVTHTAGIRPRAAYLKIIGDFCRWNDRLVFGCDDAARSEFLNKRRVKGAIAGPGQSQSNLWFTDPEIPDHLGPTLANGAVWLRDAVNAGACSEPFLFAGWQRRAAHFVNEGSTPASLVIESDALGTGQWKPLQTVQVPPGAAIWRAFGADATGEWVRVRTETDQPSLTVLFTYSNPDSRSSEPAALFTGLARVAEDTPHWGGWVRARGENRRTLQLAAIRQYGADSEEVGYYELTGDLRLQPVNDPHAHATLRTNVAVPQGVASVESASVLIVDDQSRRWRLPKTAAAYDAPTLAGQLRLAREVVTERDLLSVHGTFYELPAENAGGFARMRPVATHPFRVMDYCSYRGLLILTGIQPHAPPSRHLLRSPDGRAAVWAGAIDDLWQLGKPRGRGGPWHETPIQAGEPSDPYLFWGYDRRRLNLTASAPVTVRVEVDLTGDGFWVKHQTFAVALASPVRYDFPPAFQARWIRFVGDAPARVTARLDYD